MGVGIHYIKNSSYPVFHKQQVPNHQASFWSDEFLFHINRTQNILQQTT